MEKLKLNKEFRRVYGRGMCFAGQYIVCYIMPCRSEEIRFGITVSKKIGCAVKRNRAKRVITAAFRECIGNIKSGCDVVFVARSRILTAKSYNVKAAMQESFMNAGFWQE